jgi:hypothetical protein
LLDNSGIGNLRKRGDFRKKGFSRYGGMRGFSRL